MNILDKEPYKVVVVDQIDDIYKLMINSKHAVNKVHDTSIISNWRDFEQALGNVWGVYARNKILCTIALWFLNAITCGSTSSLAVHLGWGHEIGRPRKTFSGVSQPHSSSCWAERTQASVLGRICVECQGRRCIASACRIYNAHQLALLMSQVGST